MIKWMTKEKDVLNRKPGKLFLLPVKYTAVAPLKGELAIWNMLLYDSSNAQNKSSFNSEI